MKDGIKNFLIMVLLVFVVISVSGLFYYGAEAIDGKINNQETEGEPQPFTPITYHIIECNIAGFPDQFDYVIEISTRDPEEVGRIIRLLEGGE